MTTKKKSEFEITFLLILLVFFVGLEIYSISFDSVLVLCIRSIVFFIMSFAFQRRILDDSETERGAKALPVYAIGFVLLPLILPYTNMWHNSLVAIDFQMGVTTICSVLSIFLTGFLLYEQLGRELKKVKFGFSIVLVANGFMAGLLFLMDKPFQDTFRFVFIPVSTGLLAQKFTIDYAEYRKKN